MRINASNTINSIVEAMLQRGTENKLLHICVEVGYQHFPHANTSNGNNCSDEISYTKFLHFIFYRPSNYTKVFLLKSSSRFLSNGGAFSMTSDHDSAWRMDGVWSPLCKIHTHMVDKIKDDCKKLGVKITENLMLSQPQYSWIETIKLLDGEVERGIGYKHPQAIYFEKDGGVALCKASSFFHCPCCGDESVDYEICPDCNKAMAPGRRPSNFSHICDCDDNI